MRREHLALVGHAIKRVTRDACGRRQVEPADVVGRLAVDVGKAQPQVAERLIRRLLQRLGHDLLAQQRVGGLLVAVEDELAHLRQRFEGVGVDRVVRAAGPDGGLVETDALVGHAAEHHAGQPAVANGQRLDPLLGGRVVPKLEGGVVGHVHGGGLALIGSGRKALEREHGGGVVLAERLEAGLVEVQAVVLPLRALRGDDVRGRHDVGQLGEHVLVERRAHAALLGAEQFAGEKGHVLRVEIEVAQQAVVDSLDLAGPFLVAGIRLALVQQHALDHARLLGDFAHVDEPLIRVVAVRRGHAFEPVGGVVEVLLLGVGALLVELDARAGDADVDHADAVIFGQHLDHPAAEEVDRAHPVVLAVERRISRIPVSLLALEARHVDGGEHAEALGVAVLKVVERPGPGLHVRLAEAQVNEEFGVGPGIVVGVVLPRRQDRRARQQREHAGDERQKGVHGGSFNGLRGGPRRAPAARSRRGGSARSDGWCRRRCSAGTRPARCGGRAFP